MPAGGAGGSTNDDSSTSSAPSIFSTPAYSGSGGNSLTRASVATVSPTSVASPNWGGSTARQVSQPGWGGSGGAAGLASGSGLVTPFTVPTAVPQGINLPGAGGNVSGITTVRTTPSALPDITNPMTAARIAPPTAPIVVPEAPLRYGDGAHGDNPQKVADVMNLQGFLLDNGFSPGKLDGWYGERTKKAYGDYLRSKGIISYSGAVTLQPVKDQLAARRAPGTAPLIPAPGEVVVTPPPLPKKPLPGGVIPAEAYGPLGRTGFGPQRGRANLAETGDKADIAKRLKAAEDAAAVEAAAAAEAERRAKEVAAQPNIFVSPRPDEELRKLGDNALVSGAKPLAHPISTPDTRAKPLPEGTSTEEQIAAAAAAAAARRPYGEGVSPDPTTGLPPRTERMVPSVPPVEPTVTTVKPVAALTPAEQRSRYDFEAHLSKDDLKTIHATAQTLHTTDKDIIDAQWRLQQAARAPPAQKAKLPAEPSADTGPTLKEETSGKGPRLQVETTPAKTQAALRKAAEPAGGSSPLVDMTDMLAYWASVPEGAKAAIIKHGEAAGLKPTDAIAQDYLSHQTQWESHKKFQEGIDAESAKRGAKAKGKSSSIEGGAGKEMGGVKITAAHNQPMTERATRGGQRVAAVALSGGVTPGNQESSGVGLGQEPVRRMFPAEPPEWGPQEQLLQSPKPSPGILEEPNVPEIYRPGDSELITDARNKVPVGHPYTVLGVTRIRMTA